MFARRRLRALAPLILLATILPLSATPVSADVGATVPAGFRDRLVWAGLTDPTAVSFAPSGKVFVAQKDGRIQVFDSLNDPTPTQFAEPLERRLQLLGPRPPRDGRRPGSRPSRTSTCCTPTTTSSAMAPPRRGGAVAAWPTGARARPAATPTAAWSRVGVERLTVDGDGMGARKTLITDWCQQFPSHSIGSLAFGPEGALYVSGGDGASFNGVDYGQLGGTQRQPGADAGQPVRRPDRRGRGAALAGHPDLRRPDEPRRVDPSRRSGDGRGLAGQRQRVQQRHEQAPDHRLWAAQPVPHHGPSRRPRLDRRRRVEHVGGDQRDHRPGWHPAELRLAVLRRHRDAAGLPGPRPPDLHGPHIAEPQRLQVQPRIEHRRRGRLQHRELGRQRHRLPRDRGRLPDQVRQRPVLLRLQPQVHLVRPRQRGHAELRGGGAARQPQPRRHQRDRRRRRLPRRSRPRAT